MKSVGEVTKLTGISARTLQYYDEIDLLKPSEYTNSGYRLYNDESLICLQQILFFKELGFELKEIKEMLNKADFDRISAFRQQKELLLLKRNRTDKLIQLLERLEKGETCMSFKEFDLSEYILALEKFKEGNSDIIRKYWGSIDNFDRFIQIAREDESEIGKRAVKHYGSIEKYTEAMKYNLDHFSDIMDHALTEDTKNVIQEYDALYRELTADLSMNVQSEKIQSIVQKIDTLRRANQSDTVDNSEIWSAIIHAYTNEYIKNITDTKYGAGASEFMVKAFTFFTHQE